VADNDYSETGSSYDQVAQDYADKYLHEFDHKPFDRELLDRFAAMIPAGGRVVDLGCGPGQVARYLASRGVNVSGIDLSQQMVEQARRLNPGIDFQQGDMRQLDLPDESLAGIAAFYAIIHIPHEETPAVMSELWRVLAPGGLFLLSFHAGQEVRHMDEFFGKTVNLNFRFFERDEMAAYLQAGGFVVDEVLERPPYPDVEAQTTRVYMLARKPA
jgi:SAM-dependent methyltransferase